jgi:hypothetical protein
LRKLANHGCQIAQFTGQSQITRAGFLSDGIAQSINVFNGRDLGLFDRLKLVADQNGFIAAEFGGAWCKGHMQKPASDTEKATQAD